MVRVYVEEFLTAGGGFVLDIAPVGSLMAEGRAMVEAIVADFLAVPCVAVTMPWDVRLGSPPAGTEARPVGSADDLMMVRSQALATCDVAFPIAPECGGALTDVTQKIAESGVRLLTPGPALTALAGDKNRLAMVLASAGIAGPRGWSVGGASPWPPWSGVCVVKPADGAGCDGIVRFSDRASYEAFTADRSARSMPSAGQGTLRSLEPTGFWRLERWVEGQPASCLVVATGDRLVTCPAATQTLTLTETISGQRVSYQGGQVGLPPAWDHAARSAARNAVAAAAAASGERPVGMIGVDLVLTGNALDRQPRATVIEINPRLTTSYVGLRRAVSRSLVAGLLDSNAAAAWPDEIPLAQPVRFGMAGEVVPWDVTPGEVGTASASGESSGCFESNFVGLD